MNAIVDIFNGCVFNVFAEQNQRVQAYFENKDYKCKTYFTVVAAVGKAKTYSQIESLQGAF